MSAAASAATSAPLTKRVPGKPFRRGRSPNPGGKIAAGKRYQELRADIVGSLDGELCGLDAIAVDQIVQQLLRAERAKDHAEAARCSRTAQLWLKGLQARRATREDTASSLGRILRAGIEQQREARGG